MIEASRTTAPTPSATEPTTTTEATNAPLILEILREPSQPSSNLAEHNTLVIPLVAVHFMATNDQQRVQVFMQVDLIIS